VTGILLIHGAWHGPWCWNAFAGRLRERGHEVRAARLRGHSGQPGRIWHRIRDYVEDVERAATAFDRPPVPVGHSMGGLLAQKYLERNPAPAAVLMASVPPDRVLRVVARLAARHPVAFSKANALLRLRPLVSGTSLVRDLFFTAETPQAVVDDCHAQLQDESYPALLDMALRRVRARPGLIGAPVLVLGTEDDGFLTVDDVRRTALAHRTEAAIFRGLGHDMMLDQGWESVADCIDAWLRDIAPTPESPRRPPDSH
jgi:alpha-beta hydrolase superfamily lysophospholipase